MSRKALLWTLGLSLVTVLICGASIAASVLLFGGNGSSNTSFGLGDSVAIIRVEGTILTGEAPTDLFGESLPGAYSAELVRQLARAENNDRIKAVVLYVDSPGGTAFAADEIYRQVAAMTKPVVVSMASIAASGGYYISAPADEIWAQRQTLTGSLGVIIQFIDVEGFIDEYGINATTITSGEKKDTGSLFREMTPEEQAIWQELVDESHDIFVNIIVDGRNLPEDEVRTLADGRIYSAKQALEAGLIDQIGTLDEAVERAAELGGIEGSPNVLEYSTRGRSVLGTGASNLFRNQSAVDELQTLLQKFNTPPTLMYLYTGP